jgi:hypothetical protein
LESAVQCPGVQRPEANTSDICVTSKYLPEAYFDLKADSFTQFLLVLLLYTIPEGDPAHTQKSVS